MPKAGAISGRIQPPSYEHKLGPESLEVLDKGFNV